MNAMWMTKNHLLWYAIELTALALVIGGLIVLINTLRTQRGKRLAFLTGLNMTGIFLLFLILMDCARYAYLTEPDPRYQFFQVALFEAPWWLYAAMEVLFGLLLGWFFRNDFQYRRSHLTPEAIHETVDLLPEGICISSADGTVRLSNLQINTVCRQMTGGVLSDAVRFQEQIETAGEKQGEEILVRMPDGTIRRFSRDKLTENGEIYDRITVTDVTAQYRVTEELQKKNERLRDIQRRMKEVSELSGDMFIAREEANARATLHNQLGQVLLMGRYTLEHPESTDANMVLTATREMNRFLLREAEVLTEAETEVNNLGEDLLQQTLAMVKSIGVTAEIHGEMPNDSTRRVLLAHAIQECAVNTVKHAEGDWINAELKKEGVSLTVRITNNGKAPKGIVAESGGLLSLRRSVEEVGGRMTVESQPVFVLHLTLPGSTSYQ